MPLVFTRIESAIDITRILLMRVVIIGLGGSVTLVCDLARCGVRYFTLVDFDHIEPSNVTRQDHDTSRIGQAKVDAVAQRLREINPEIQVNAITEDFTKMSVEELDRRFGEFDLLVMATDSFPAQARGNELALRRNIPAVFIGLYEEGRGGEIVFWHPDLDPCFRCLCSARYAAFAAEAATAITSHGATVLDIRIVDGIAAMIAIGLLTRGADNRYGRLIEQLGDRNFLQVKIDPTFGWNGRDIFRELLEIPEGNDTYFSFVTVARRDPDGGALPCTDCERFRGHQFVVVDGRARRVKPGDFPAEQYA